MSVINEGCIIKLGDKKIVYAIYLVLQTMLLCLALYVRGLSYSKQQN